MYNEFQNWNNNLESVRKIFGFDAESSNPKLRSQLLRKMAHKMLQEEIIPSLFRNKQIKKMIKSYLLKLKVQSLRCRSEQLMMRSEVM